MVFKCAKCEKPTDVDVTEDVMRMLMRPPRFLCEICAAEEMRRHQADMIELAQKQREQRWNEFCPRLFQRLGREHCKDKKAFDLAMGWDLSRRGLILLGPSGTGKTLTTYKIMQREWMDRGVLGKFTTADDLALRASELACESQSAARRWMRSLATCQLLVIDDLGKRKLPEYGESILFEIVDMRYRDMLPLIVTTEFDGENITRNMDPKRAAAFVRRLRDTCKVIEFEYESIPGIVVNS